MATRRLLMMMYTVSQPPQAIPSHPKPLQVTTSHYKPLQATIGHHKPPQVLHTKYTAGNRSSRFAPGAFASPGTLNIPPGTLFHPSGTPCACLILLAVPRVATVVHLVLLVTAIHVSPAIRARGHVVAVTAVAVRASCAHGAVCHRQLPITHVTRRTARHNSQRDWTLVLHVSVCVACTLGTSARWWLAHGADHSEIATRRTYSL